MSDCDTKYNDIFISNYVEFIKILSYYRLQFHTRTKFIMKITLFEKNVRMGTYLDFNEVIDIFGIDISQMTH